MTPFVTPEGVKRKPWLAFVALIAASSASASAFADEPSPPETPAPAEEPDKAAPPPKGPVIVGLRFDGGWSARRLLDIPVTGADMGIGFGAQFSPRFAVWNAARVLVGSTEHGLRVWDARLGPEAELVLDRFRLGAGLGVMLLGVSRAARSETLVSWGPEARATARFDFVRTESFALFARAAFDAAYEVYDGSLFWGPTFGAGGDFDIAGKRPPR
jgi:hypothetical protein